MELISGSKTRAGTIFPVNNTRNFSLRVFLMLFLACYCQNNKQVLHHSQNHHIARIHRRRYLPLRRGFDARLESLLARRRDCCQVRGDRPHSHRLADSVTPLVRHELGAFHYPNACEYAQNTV